jgi:hypothetical protein
MKDNALMISFTGQDQPVKWTLEFSGASGK